MATAYIHLRPVLTGEGRAKRWSWKITRTIGDAVAHVVYATKPEATKGLKWTIDDAIASGFMVEATSLDQTEQGFRAVYDVDGRMIEHQKLKEGAVLGPRCSNLPRTPAAAKARAVAVRAKKKAEAAAAVEAPKPPRRRKPPAPAPVVAPVKPVPTKPKPVRVPPKAPKKPKEGIRAKPKPVVVAPKPTSAADGRGQSAGTRAALDAYRAAVASYKAAHPGVSHRDAQAAVKAQREGGATVAAPKPPSRVPTPVPPRIPTPKPPSAKPVSAKPPPRTPTPATIVPPVEADDEAAKVARMMALMEQAMGTL